MMPRLVVLLVLAAALCAAPLHAQERRLDPVDEAARDASWASFKKRALAAIEKRDQKFMLSILDRNVRTGLDGGRGVAEFRKQWELESSDSPLWRELASAMMLPAAWHRPDKSRLELCVPYVAVRWPQDLDAFAGGALIAKDVLVKSAPSSASDTVATLAYNIVEVTNWEVNDQAADVRQKWVRIRIQSGYGYVPEEQIRSPVEHAACFVKGEAGWRLTGFGPGAGK